MEERKDNKERIYEYLKKNQAKKFSQLQIAVDTGISYPTVLKWLAVLQEEQREPQVISEKFGKIRLISASPETKKLKQKNETNR